MERQTDTRNGARTRLRASLALSFFLGLIAVLFLWQRDNFDLWMKSFHVVAVISWMAGLLYMPRLFVYHSDAAPGSQQSETFKVMEQRLMNVIMRPAMVIAWILGLYLAWSFYGFVGGWLHAKIALVVALSAFHEHLAKATKAFANDGPRRSARYWRLMNEVPTVLMIAIVVLVIVKPF